MQTRAISSLVLLRIRIEALGAYDVHGGGLDGGEGADAEHDAGNGEEEGDEEGDEERSGEELVVRQDPA